MGLMANDPTIKRIFSMLFLVGWFLDCVFNITKGLYSFGVC